MGIEPKQLEHIFDPFFTTGSRAEVSGLGLSIAHGIIREHDGRILAESNGMGAILTIEIPMVDAVDFASADPSEGV